MNIQAKREEENKPEILCGPYRRANFLFTWWSHQVNFSGHIHSFAKIFNHVMSKRCDKILSRKFQLIVNCFQFYLPKVLIIVGSSFPMVKNSSCLHHWISKLCLKAWICRFEIIFMQQSMWISFIFVRNHLLFSLLLLNIFVFKIY